MKWLFVIVLTVSLSGETRAQDESSTRAREAEVVASYQAGDLDSVIALTESFGPDREMARIRASAFERRGEQRFFEGDIEGSIEDFDGFIEIHPEQDPHHWQRGLSYYYAGEFEKGKAQFERHQTVNTQDVENAVWHFLCAVRVPGGDVKAAQEALIPIESDLRIPMKEVHDLFGGRGSEADVMEAVSLDEEGEVSERERNHLCYAHLYLGLYYEALGDAEKSAGHIRKAAFEYSMDHYMGKTAQVHAKLRGIVE